MSERAHEIEALALAMFAAVPLYLTQTIGPVPIVVYHAVMLAIVLRVAAGKSAEVVPAWIMRGLAIAYIGFYAVDAAAISRSAIAASTHLVLFISAYQPIESMRRRNDAQRLLITALIFTASIASATHVSILPFVIVFAFFFFRQLMHVAHRDTIAAAAATAPELPSSRAAGFYLGATSAAALMLFPLLPRVRNPIVPGLAGSLTNASTGLSEVIDLNNQRTISSDTTVVSRVTMGRDAMPFFTPLRLRGAVYDRFRNNQWLQARREFLPLDMSPNGSVRIARDSGFTRHAFAQQRFVTGTRLFLPVGTYQIDGVPQVYEGPTRDTYMVWQPRTDSILYDLRMARDVAPLTVRRVPVSNYPVTPPITSMARRIVGNHTDPMTQAADIERYLSTNFQYVPDPSKIGRRMTVDDFLLHERRGHCEYFAAGMVALMSALGTPARIVGGFYGGKLNPLTGWFVLRREDAHAWVEVYDGAAWRTFDPTPASLRPGAGQGGLLGMYASAIGDSINYFWDRRILTYGLADQLRFFVDSFESARDALRAVKLRVQPVFTMHGAAIAAAMMAVVALLYLFAWQRRPAFALLREHLARRGVEVGSAMTMEEALGRLPADDAAALAPLISLYERERFSAHVSRGARAEIRRRLAALAS
ncbi:MAG TPA: transglutaminaseTgpA domain-containing protein [Thermoanaerobaculia bacterium]|nr:transglutaminaseTgpA domain-containing protein [Thermoanaerobaculia bacterium]